MKPEIKKKMESIFGEDNVTDKAHDLLPYSYDATECNSKMPDFVCLVENTEQVVDMVKYANEKKLPLIPYISGNNIGGLTIPEEGGIILDFGKKMNRILFVHENHMYALLEPGVTFGQLEQYLKKHHPHLKYSYPFAPPYSGVVGNALLSGMNNMSCAHGSMGDWINGLEVVLHDGNVVRIGSCFLSKEYRPDNWHSRYPMPDLMGLFINWQGMTGLVTKCAVQLWPKPAIESTLLAITYGEETTAEFIREIARLEIIEDISAVSVEVAKMGLGIPTPPKYPKEPDFSIIIPITAHNKKELAVKEELVQELIAKMNKSSEHKNRIQLTDFDFFAACVGEKVRMFRDLPNVITPLVEYSGLTWVGTYAPPENLGILIKEAGELFKEYDIPAFIYMKIMKASHYGIFRPIIRYKKELEESRITQFVKDMLEICLKHGCIPYKTPVHVAQRLQEIIDPNWLKFFKEVKQFMDPNRIFNPGRWGI
jgi:glycolate oxidase